MKKSAQVTLTVLAVVSGARAQQAANPCGPANFSAKACQAAVKSSGYCDGTNFVAQQFQKYPYYYNLYRSYTAAGGTVLPASVGACRGGFGATGAAHGAVHT